MWVEVCLKPGVNATDRGVVEDVIEDALNERYPGWGEVTGGGRFIDGSQSDITFEFEQRLPAGDVAALMGESAVDLLRAAAAHVEWSVSVNVDGEEAWSDAG